MKTGCIFACAIFFFLLAFSATMEAQAGKVYEISVNSEFCDCMRFSAESPGCLNIDGLGKGQVYGPTTSGGWQSTYIVRSNICGVNPHSRPSAFGIAFHGTVVGTSILGEAINDSGDLFSFTGSENPSCSLSTCNVSATSKSRNSSSQKKRWKSSRSE
jgi:hypothetical protein